MKEIRTILVMLVLSTVALAATVRAETATYPITVTSVYDGDTFNADIEIWTDITIKATVRISGLDTPELRTKCHAEKLLARQAKYRLEQLLTQTPKITNVRNGKYAGRVIADVILYGDRNITDVLIAEGHARAYDGGTKSSWCPQ